MRTYLQLWLGSPSFLTLPMSLDKKPPELALPLHNIFLHRSLQTSKTGKWKHTDGSDETGRDFFNLHSSILIFLTVRTREERKSPARPQWSFPQVPPRGSSRLCQHEPDLPLRCLDCGLCQRSSVQWHRQGDLLQLCLGGLAIGPPGQIYGQLSRRSSPG